MRLIPASLLTLLVCIFLFLPSAHASYYEQLLVNPPKTTWETRNKELYSDLLSNKQYDLVVLPFEAEGSSIDRIGRRLMSRYLIAYLEHTYNFKIANLDYLSRSLGEFRRQYNNIDVSRLLRKLGNPTYIRSHVGHDNNGNLYLKIVKYERNRKIDPYKITSSYEVNDIEFSPLNLPSELFISHLPKITENLEFGPVKNKYKRVSGNNITLTVPKNLINFKNQNPLIAAANWQIFGNLSPFNHTPARNRFFEKSLTSLLFIKQDNENYYWLKANAFLNLYRRPAALKLLNSRKSENIRILKQYANGNIVDLNSIEKYFEGTLKSLMLLNYRYIASSYIRDKNPTQEILPFLPENIAIYVQKLQKNLATNNAMSTHDIKMMLEQEYPIKGHKLDKRMIDEFITGRNNNLKAIYTAVYDHFSAVLKKHQDSLCCMSQSWKLNNTDLLALFEAHNEYAIFTNIDKLTNVQALPDRAKLNLDNVQTIYEGHPLYYQSLAAIASRKYALASANEKNKHHDDFSSAYINMAVHSQGQYPGISNGVADLAMYIAHNSSDPKNWPFVYRNKNISNIFINEFPIHDDWTVIDNDAQRIDKTINGEILKNQLRNTLFNFYFAEEYFNHQKTITSDISNNKAINELQNRFNGSPGKPAFMLKLVKSLGSDEDIRRIYSAAIKSQPEQWSIVSNYSAYLLRNGDYSTTYAILKDYPGFHNIKDKDRIAASNKAYIAGSYFFWRGMDEEASYFYAISAGMKTGSGAEYTSATRLASLNNDYLGSITHAYNRARRYQNMYAYRDTMSLMHITGQNEPAWQLFNAINTKPNTQMWTSAFIGHRKQIFSSEQLKEWINNHDFVQPDIDSQPPLNSIHLASRYTFMSLFIDRDATDEDMDYLKKINSDPKFSLYKSMPSDAELYRWTKRRKYFSAYLAYKTRKPNFTHMGDISLDNTRWFHPYFVWAFMNTNKYTPKEPIKDYLKAAEKKKNLILNDKNKTLVTEQNTLFKYYLINASYHAAEKRHDKALSFLKSAFDVRPHTQEWPIFTWYYITELAELYFLETGHQPYLDLAMDWAKRYQKIQPMFGWAYAFEAKYTKNKKDQLRALGFALYLDRQSLRISEFSDKEKQEAEQWFSKNNPFILDLNKADKETPI